MAPSEARCVLNSWQMLPPVPLLAQALPGRDGSQQRLCFRRLPLPWQGLRGKDTLSKGCSSSCLAQHLPSQTNSGPRSESVLLTCQHLKCDAAHRRNTASAWALHDLII
jgi:hypothetical protein